MNKPLMASKTRQAVDNFTGHPTAGILFEGLSGSGKEQIARYCVASVLGLSKNEAFDHYPYVFNIQPENNTISIEAVRSVQGQLVRAVPGTQPWRRAVMILDADRLTIEAQNALLKSLEEPPEDTLFVLTAQLRSSLLPTVLSRLQLIPVLPLTKQAVIEHYGNTDQVQKAFQISQGRVALLEALLAQADHPLLNQIALAKEVIGKTPYERLVMVNVLSKDRQESAALLDAMHLIATTSLHIAIEKDNTSQAKRWKKINSHIRTAQQALSKNANVKLVLTDLFGQI